MTTSTCSASSRFHDDLPGPAAVSGSDDPPAFLYVGPEARCVLEHLSEVELCELSIDHALEDMRRELELPIPPGRPPHPGWFYHRTRSAKTSGARSSRAYCGPAPRERGHLKCQPPRAKEGNMRKGRFTEEQSCACSRRLKRGRRSKRSAYYRP